MAALLGPGLPPAAVSPNSQDPMFFAEQFTSRRRRYVTVPSDIPQIAREPRYKDYTFPFITGEALPSGTDASTFPLLFKEALDTSFELPSGYGLNSTTLFEQMANQLYLQEVTSHLEQLRKSFVNSLLVPGLLVDMDFVLGPHPTSWEPREIEIAKYKPPPAGKSESSRSVSSNQVQQSFSQPTYKSYQYISTDFFNYLNRIGSGSSSPSTVCQEVMFKDNVSTSPPSTGIYVDMLPFTRVIKPESIADISLTDPAHTSLPGSALVPQLVANGLGCVDDSDPSMNGINNPILTQTNARTVEEAYDRLRSAKGNTPLERYLQFITFIYIFFDHIPQAQKVISAMLSPLVGMVGGIIDRGIYVSVSNGPLLMSSHLNTRAMIERLTTFHWSQIAFIDRSSSREDAIHAVLRMYRLLRDSRAALASLLMFDASISPVIILSLGFSDPAIVSERDILDTLLKIPLQDLKPTFPKDRVTALSLYSGSGINEFKLPSVGSAHMILPVILGIPESHILRLVYDLNARWFHSQAQYNAAIDRIEGTAAVVAQFKKYSSGRYGYTDTAVTMASLIIPRMPAYVKITKFPPSVLAVYVDDANPLPPLPPSDTIDHYYVTRPPHSWQQLLYPGYISHAIVEQEIIRPVANTMVRPCYQDTNFSIAFPSRLDLSIGGYVEVNGFDINSSPLVFSAIFEFPANVYSITLPASIVVSSGPLSQLAYTNFPGSPSLSAVNSFTMQRGSSSSRGPIVHRLVLALDITTIVSDVTAWSQQPLSMTSNVFEAGPPILHDRSPFVWSSLSSDITTPPANVLKFTLPPSGSFVFFPAVLPELFLSSLFDWKLQLFYLSILRRFLTSRSALQPVLDEINDLLDPASPNALSPGVINSLQKSEEYGSPAAESRAAYIRDNTIPNLVEPAAPTVYSGFKNLLYNIIGPTVASSSLASILKTPAIIDSAKISMDTKRFYVIQQPLPAGSRTSAPLEYDIDIGDYINLFKARVARGIVKADGLIEKTEDQKTRLNKEAADKRESNIAALVAKSGNRLKDPYSILIDEVVIRNLLPTTTS